MKTLVFVFGTRPELIKLAPLILLAKKNPVIKTIVCSTGQHREMLQSLYRLFDFNPDIDFNLMQPNQSLLDLHAQTMLRSRELFEKSKPDWVIVQGDTTSAHAAALAAFYLKIPVAHVEAGLRTYDMSSPFPEELNRRAIGLVARAHFCPTVEAAANLQSERNTSDAKIYVTGNTGIDALRLVSEKNNLKTAEIRSQLPNLNFSRFILATLHRRENFGEAQKNILKAFREIVLQHEVDILFPVHPNPKVRESVKSIFGEEDTFKGKGQIHFVDPLDYATMVECLQSCQFVLTDSGGLQEEAPSFGKRILVLRESTERPEAVKAGFSQLVGTETQSILNAAENLLTQKNQSLNAPNPYGDGQAAEKILELLIQ